MSSILQADVEEGLRKSVTFAMSRGGRELFHTNFFAFILESNNESEFFQKVRTNLLHLLFGEGIPNQVIALREKFNMDLMLIPSIEDIKKATTCRIVIIEAKLKSIPTHQQLMEYNSKLENVLSIDIDGYEEFLNEENSPFKELKIDKDSSGYKVTLKSTEDKTKNITTPGVTIRKILLTPESYLEGWSESDFDGWESLDWHQLLACIPDLIDSRSKEDLLNQTLVDYKKSTTNVAKLIESSIDHANQFIGHQHLTYQPFYEDIQDSKKLRSLRVHDLVGKVVFNKLENALAKKINEVLDNQTGFEFVTQTFYTNSTPGLQCLFQKKDGKKLFEIGIQIQGNDYRHFISKNFNSNKELIELGNDVDIYQWMKMSGLNKGKRGSDEFKVYDKNKFIYLSHPIKDETYEQLSAKILESMQSLEHVLRGKNEIIDAFFTGT